MIVDCDMRKWGDRPHWRFMAQRLGRDEHGIWLGAGARTAYTGPRGAGEWTHRFVVCIPDDDWWIATFNERTWGPEVYVDVTSPATWISDTHVTAIDLDLDVFRTWEGVVELDDEDEFEDHKIAFGYPDDVIASAVATTKRLMDDVAERREPFGAVGSLWLDRVPAGGLL